MNENGKRITGLQAFRGSVDEARRYNLRGLRKLLVKWGMPRGMSKGPEPEISLLAGTEARVHGPCGPGLHSGTVEGCCWNLTLVTVVHTVTLLYGARYSTPNLERVCHLAKLFRSFLAYGIALRHDNSRYS